MLKKTLVVAVAAAFASLAAAGTASAAGSSTDLADFHLKVTSAKIVVPGLLDDGVEVPGTDPALAGKTIDLDGVISKGGTVKLAPIGFEFPAVAVDISGVSATLDVIQASPSTGKLATGSGTTLPINLGVALNSDALNVHCLIKGLNFNFKTSDLVAGSTTLFGSAWNSTTGALAVTGSATIPALSTVSDSDCDPGSKGLITLAGLPGKTVAIKLDGKTTIGAKYLAPAKMSVSSTTIKASKGSGTVQVSCAGNSGKARDCVGSVALTVGGVTGTPVAVNLKPGKKATLKIALSSGQVSKVGTKTLSGSLVASYERGTATVTKSVKVSNKK